MLPFTPPPPTFLTWLAMTSVRRPATRSSSIDSTGRMISEGRAVPAASPAATSAMSTANWAASLGGMWECDTAHGSPVTTQVSGERPSERTLCKRANAAPIIHQHTFTHLETLTQPQSSTPTPGHRAAQLQRHLAQRQRRRIQGRRVGAGGQVAVQPARSGAIWVAGRQGGSRQPAPHVQALAVKGQVGGVGRSHMSSRKAWQAQAQQAKA